MVIPLYQESAGRTASRFPHATCHVLSAARGIVPFEAEVCKSNLSLARISHRGDAARRSHYQRTEADILDLRFSIEQQPRQHREGIEDRDFRIVRNPAT
jgi:hypothetical protein